MTNKETFTVELGPYNLVVKGYLLIDKGSYWEPSWEDVEEMEIVSGFDTDKAISEVRIKLWNEAIADNEELLEHDLRVSDIVHEILCANDR
jgi:hypothetical protein